MQLFKTGLKLITVSGSNPQPQHSRGQVYAISVLSSPFGAQKEHQVRAIPGQKLRCFLDLQQKNLGRMTLPKEVDIFLANKGT